MKTRNYWPLFFIGIFGFTLIMIIWTIMKAVQSPVIEDRSFMQKYQYVDDNYNTIMESNDDFMRKYDLIFVLNDKEFGLTTEDIKYGQRVIKKQAINKDVLKLGKNNLTVTIVSKDDKQKKDIKIDLVVTKTMSDESDINLSTSNFENVNNDYKTNFTIEEETNWNITGTFEVENSIGYIFIKTNAR